MTLILGAVPPLGWLGRCAYEYHHPDLRQPEWLEVVGMTPDGDAALVRAAVRQGWLPVLARVDLTTGVATQLGGIRAGVSEGLGPFPGYGAPRRIFGITDADGMRWLDLATGREERAVVDLAAAAFLPPPQQLAAAAAEDARGAAAIALPAGKRAWFEGRTLVFADASGREEQRMEWPARTLAVQAGHGLRTGGGRAFDLVRRSWFDLPKDTRLAYAVDGRWVVGDGNERLRRFDPATGALDDCPELADGRVDSPFDDTRLLLSRRVAHQSIERFVYDVATRTLTPLGLPPVWAKRDPLELSFFTVRATAAPTRDRQGRIWFAAAHRGRHVAFATIDPATLQCEEQLVGVGAVHHAWVRLLALQDEAMLIVEGRERIVRIDLATGVRTVLYPRDAAEVPR